MTDVTPEARSAVAIGAVFANSAVTFGERVLDGDWPGALALVRRAYRLEILDRWWAQKRLPVQDLRALLPNAWLEAEPATELRWWPLFRDAGFCGHPPPSVDPLLIYRGGQRDDPVGMVWLRDLEAARRAALRWPRAETTSDDGRRMLAGVVTTASVPRAAISAHIVHRLGSEIIAHPRVVQVLGRERIEEPLL
jgi:hypothetical protein